MLRTFNYTGRKRVNKQDVQIHLTDNGDLPPTFNATLKLDESLPSHCKIYIEAYFKVTSQRFYFGTVGNIRPPTDREITEVNLSGRTMFRVIVVDESLGTGTIVASGDKIAPSGPLANADSMMHIMPAPLGHLAWKLDFPDTDEFPVLLVNKEIPDSANRFQNDATLLAVVIPAAFREVLTHYVLVNTEDHEDGEAKTKWLQFAEFLSPLPDEGSERELYLDWIDRVVEAFCRQHNFIAALRRDSEEDG